MKNFFILSRTPTSVEFIYTAKCGHTDPKLELFETEAAARRRIRGLNPAYLFEVHDLRKSLIPVPRTPELEAKVHKLWGDHRERLLEREKELVPKVMQLGKEFQASVTGMYEYLAAMPEPTVEEPTP